MGAHAPAYRPVRSHLGDKHRVLAAACGLYHILVMTCARSDDVPVNNAHYLDHRVDASEWLLHARIRTSAYGVIAPLTHAKPGVTVPGVLRDLGPVELAVNPDQRG